MKILKDKCKGCTKCIKSCPFSAIIMANNIADIGSSCTGCGVCVKVCPFGAIEKKKKKKKKLI
ncbi:Na+-translocating ferredoxin:NAD+ oxidoreductase RNF subunit RnfB [Clostridium beijerinckii]|nr:Na+-translocating ferredoxin:NAD+ oxidoreductase RNF subunit RnfB [Clostridium beijerinckii]NSB11084.1 Na+-translocating ferredoxin:NAD+ oxidoreductase RNF subunit RnfB [Clostridium beijerinckii]